MPRLKSVTQPPGKPLALRVPQARVLRALLPSRADDPQDEWPLLARSVLAVRAGYSPVSGSITRALNGIKRNSSSGDPHAGLINLKLCIIIRLNIDGVIEDNYRITKEGIRAIQQFLLEGNKLPKVRDAEAHINNRYRKEN